MSNCRFWHGWVKGNAHVWAWSAQDPTLDVRENEHPLPESALCPVPAGDVVRLLQCIEGYEGQCWKDEELLHSRWWADVPSQHSWNGFLRAAGRQPATIPVPEMAEWTAQPWVRAGVDGFEWLVKNEKSLVTGTAALLLFVLGLQLAGLSQATREKTRWQGQVDSLSRMSASELGAREGALDNVAMSSTLVAQASEPTALELMHRVMSVRPTGVVLTEWRQNGRQLEFVIQSDVPPNPEDVVRSVQDVPFLESVLVERERAGNALRVQATVNSPGAVR